MVGLDELMEKDSRFLARDDSAIPVEIVSADGAVLKTSDGREYVDFLSAYSVTNAGWNRKEILDAIRKSESLVYTYPNMLDSHVAGLAELLASIVPGRLRKSYRATSGSEAVEIAMQAAISKTGKTAFLAFEGAYHGRTIAEHALIGGMPAFFGESGGSASLGGLKAMLDCRQIPPPYDPMGRKDAEAAERSVEALRQELMAGKYAAFIFEPIAMNIDAMVPPKEFYAAVAEECGKVGTLIVADEVACGFGRTGRMFACEHYGLEPDAMPLGKGLSSGYAPIGATIVTEEVQKAMKFYTYSTFGWTPLAAITTAANIRLIMKEKLWENAERMGEYITKRIEEIGDERIAAARGKGLLLSLVLSSDGKRPDVSLGRRLQQECLRRDLLTGFAVNGLLLMPPLNISKNDVDRGIGILEEALKTV